MPAFVDIDSSGVIACLASLPVWRHCRAYMRPALSRMILWAKRLRFRSKVGARCNVRPKPHQLISGWDRPVPRSLMRGHRAPRRDGTHLDRGVLQPCPATVTHPPWIDMLVSESLSHPLPSDSPAAWPGAQALRMAPSGTSRL